jgi:sulfur-oxidizing protein SoxY
VNLGLNYFEAFMNKRRQALKTGLALGAMGTMSSLVWQEAQAYDKAAFESKTWQDALKALGVATPKESSDVVFLAPDIAENGAVVPISASCALPGIKRIIFLVEKNPAPLVAVFNVSEDVLANFSARCKMGQTSMVYAVAVGSDSQAYMAKKEVKVTLGGCGG